MNGCNAGEIVTVLIMAFYALAALAMFGLVVLMLLDAINELRRR